MVGLQRQSPLVAGERFLETLQHKQDVAMIEVKLRLVRLQGRGALIAGERLGKALQRQQNETAIAIDFGARGASGNRPVNQLKRRRAVTAAMRDQTEKI